MTASRRFCTPLFLKADPQITGQIWILMVLFLIAERISSTVNSSPARYFSIRASSFPDNSSIIFSLYSTARSSSSAGISVTLNVAPRDSSSQIIAFISTRSITPVNVSSLPIGSCIGKGFALRRSLIMETPRKKSAPTLSILLTKAILGTRYLSACLQTVSD